MKKTVCLVLVVLLLLSGCASNYELAQKQYDEGNFDEAITLLLEDDEISEEGISLIQAMIKTSFDNRDTDQLKGLVTVVCQREDMDIVETYLDSLLSESITAWNVEAITCLLTAMDGYDFVTETHTTEIENAILAEEVDGRIDELLLMQELIDAETMNTLVGNCIIKEKYAQALKIMAGLKDLSGYEKHIEYIGTTMIDKIQRAMDLFEDSIDQITIYQDDTYKDILKMAMSGNASFTIKPDYDHDACKVISSILEELKSIKNEIDALFPLQELRIVYIKLSDVYDAYSEVMELALDLLDRKAYVQYVLNALAGQSQLTTKINALTSALSNLERCINRA